MTAISHIIKDIHIEQFKKDGVVLIKNAFSNEWLKKLEIGIEKNMQNPSKYADLLNNDNNNPNSPKFFGDYCNWKNIKEFKDVIYNSPAALIASKLMESNKAIFYHEHVLGKSQNYLLFGLK